MILTRLQELSVRAPALFWAGIAATGLSLFGMVAAIATIPQAGIALPSQLPLVVELELDPMPELLGESDFFFHEEMVRRSDTLVSIFERMRLNDEAALDYLRKTPDAREFLRRLSPGQMITASSLPNGELRSLELPAPGSERMLVLERRNGKLSIHAVAPNYQVRTQSKSGVISSSLFAATDSIGLPDSVATNLADIFSHQVDFHSDLRKGDNFRVVYEVLQRRGLAVRAGRILAAEFINDGKRHTAIWNPNAGGKGAYYSADGRPLQSGFMRSPLEFSRVTSGMGLRVHPVTGVLKKHQGVDYGAPHGTRVRATANGEVAFAGFKGGYGNVVILSHAGGIETVYAHLSRIHVRQGQKVSQNDNIGAVGATGTATGPHLHYEFRVAGVHRDPLRIALPEAPPLSGSALASFRARASALISEMRSVSEPSLLTARVD